jgi:hypothetical protein
MLKTISLSQPFKSNSVVMITTCLGVALTLRVIMILKKSGKGRERRKDGH